MIGTYHRINSFRNCRRKYFNFWFQGLVAEAPEANTSFGTILHEAIPLYLTTKKLDAALTCIENLYKTNIEQLHLPESIKEAEAMFRLATQLMMLYASSWKDDFEIVVPEYQGKVDLLDGKHQLMFKTDAVIVFNKRLWLLERKTLSPRVSVDNYIQLMMLDQQAPTYMLCIGKHTLGKVEPFGYILEIIRKVTTTDALIREPIIKTQEQLVQLEKELYQTLDEIETLELRVKSGEDASVLFPKTTSMGTCQEYFKPCWYQGMCNEERIVPNPKEFSKRIEDYVELERKIVKE